MSDADPDTKRLLDTLRAREVETRIPDMPPLADGEILFAGAVRRLLREKHGLPDVSAWEVAILSCRSLKKLGRLVGANAGKVAEMATAALRREGRLP